ncbi:hypothetical protein EO93_01275 [Methanosarcina sp. 1.H.A.2.2]|nr:hypothetical protein EO93_01275 [Methanosarcina sp. 1.H.A.2.2]
MPVYKGDEYLSEAVDSILNQTFSDFEFIIICDDPTDETHHIFDKYQQNDSRIMVYYQERQGLVNSLNKGISLARGEYIARMDADDISLSTRFEKQVEFMDKNLEIGICGTWVKTIGDSSGSVWNNPCDHDTIKSRMLFESVIAHPSIILRKDIFLSNNLAYRQDETYAEDYGLWVRAIKKLKFANIPEILLHYRVHNSTSNKYKQKEISNRVRLSQVRELGISPTNVEIEIHEALSCYRFDVNDDFISNAKSWLQKLQNANFSMKIYPEPAFSNVLANRCWYLICYNFRYLGLGSWNCFHNPKLSQSVNLSYVQKARLLLKNEVRLFLLFGRLFI